MRVALVSAMLALTLNAGAEDGLSVEELLESSAQHYPEIVESLAARREAAGKALAAEGEFDLVFDADGYGSTGFYDSIALDGTVRQRLRNSSASLYAGYKLSNGPFPIYEDKRLTNTGGAFRVGILFSLLRDRNIDSDRFELADATMSLEAAELELLLTRIGVQQRALLAYWKWVTAGRQLRVYENLLRLATERQSALEEQNRQGAIARIVLTENQRTITRRQTLVTVAANELAVTANALSLFYRDEQARPLVPEESDLPPGVQISDIDTRPVDGMKMADQALTGRPELLLLRNTIERETRRIALKENDLKPRLDFGVEVQRGVGAIAEGGASRDETDTVVGLTFSVPLQQREARGELDAARARLERRRAEEQLRKDQISVEIRNLVLDLELAKALLSLAAEEVRQSELLRAAEIRRFDSGASDFFLVNVREEEAANARIRLLDAEFRTRISRANYDAAGMNLSSLGLETSIP